VCQALLMRKVYNFRLIDMNNESYENYNFKELILDLQSAINNEKIGIQEVKNNIN
jgi:hypothetical protein